MQRPVPQALSVHLETLQQALSQHQTSDYWTSLLCNAYSTNVECFSRPMGVLVEAIQGELMAVEIWYNNYLLQHLLSDLFCFICW